MLARAKKSAEKAGITNVKFIKSPITAIDLPSNSTDCIISNCVINLVPHHDKHLVFEEIFRLLKPGGRVSISDILAKRPISPQLQQSVISLCIQYETAADSFKPSWTLRWLYQRGQLGRRI
jgi:ubiquinone/menaquinone biosynthesis C-methylase UbiE